METISAFEWVVIGGMVTIIFQLSIIRGNMKDIGWFVRVAADHSEETYSLIHRYVSFKHPKSDWRKTHETEVSRLRAEHGFDPDGD